MASADRFELLPFAPGFWVHKPLAIVGSSSNLKGRGLGSEIDSHAEVIRFNQATVLGFERDVGSKTSIRLIGANTNKESIARSFAAAVISDDARLLTKPSNRPSEAIAFAGRPVTYLEGWPVATRTAFAKLQRFTGLHFEARLPPRTGIALLSVLLDISGGSIVPSMYGFDTQDEVNPQWRQHYYDAKPKPDFHTRVAERHAPVEYEWETLKALHARGHIRLPGQS